MNQRQDYTGFTWHVFNTYIEFVFCKGILKTIAFNYKTRQGKTFRLIDFK